MFSLKNLLFLFCFSIVLHPVLAQCDTARTGLLDKGVSLAESMIDRVTFEKGGHVLSVYPVVGYAPRTGVEIGIMPVWKIGGAKSEVSRPSTLASSLQLSSRGMLEMKLDLVSYLSGGWMLWSKVQYLYLPDKFYGLGNHVKREPFAEYELNSMVVSADVAKGIGEKWFLGIRMDLNHNRHSNSDGEILNQDITGYSGGWANGLGPMMVYDARDNVLYPQRGWMIMASCLWYTKFAGSDFDFSLWTYDVRKYFSFVNEKSVLAMQAVLSAANGEVPFYKLPGVGGKNSLRGIPHPHKYLDEKSWYSQVEWRQHVWWRLGAVAFAGIGRVMPDWSSSWTKDLHAVAGAGLRFRALPKDGLNFRIDYGVSNHNENSLFFTIREAF